VLLWRKNAHCKRAMSQRSNNGIFLLCLKSYLYAKGKLLNVRRSMSWAAGRGAVKRVVFFEKTDDARLLPLLIDLTSYNLHNNSDVGQERIALIEQTCAFFL